MTIADLLLLMEEVLLIGVWLFIAAYIGLVVLAKIVGAAERLVGWAHRR